MATTEVGKRPLSEADGVVATTLERLSPRRVLPPGRWFWPLVTARVRYPYPWPAGTPALPVVRVLRMLHPALLYLGVRGVGLLGLRWLTVRNGTTVGATLRSWDGHWYLAIAADGYGGVPAGLTDALGHRNPTTALAFFPGYPLLTRVVADLSGIGSIDAALGVSAAAGVLGGYALVRLGVLVAGSRTVGLVLVVLFAASPMGVVLSMAYSEALFCALAAWALVGVLERRWLLAGLTTTAAGLTRPTAAALVVVIMLAAAWAAIHRQDSWRPWVGGLLAPVGLLGYLAFVAWRTDELTGWFAVQQRGWDAGFDGGAATARFTVAQLTKPRSVLELATVAVLLGALALAVLSMRMRLPWPLLGYGLLVLAMDIGSDGLMNSKVRLLLPAFTLLLPIAVGLARRRRGTTAIVLVAVVLASAWFGGYAITAWGYAI